MPPANSTRLHLAGAAGGLLLTFSTPGAWAAPPLAAGATADEVLACLRSNVSETLQVDEFSLSRTSSAGGARTVVGQLLTQHEDKKLRASLKLRAPSDVAGQDFLVRELGGGGEEMYLYLPSINKVRRINGKWAADSLFNTDVSYQDFRYTQFAFEGRASILQKATTLDGRPARVLSLVPAAGQGPYSLVRVWVDDATCVALKTELETGGKLAKRLSVDAASLKQVGKYWYAETSTFENQALGTRTVLSVKGLRVDEVIPLNRLTVGSFYR